MNWFQFFRFFKYVFSAGHYKGFGIHSPFVFYLVHDLMYEKHPYYAFGRISALRKGLLNNRAIIENDTYGADSRSRRSKKNSVSRIVKTGSLHPKYGQLIFRLINRLDITNIVELGTGVGAGTLYLALSASQSRIFTLEGNAGRVRVARSLFLDNGIGNVDVVQGRFSERLPDVLEKIGSVDLVFFDGDHRKEPTLEYFNSCLKKAHDNSLFVFDDIHWSPGMEKAWTEIISHPQVTVSIDLFRIGLVFFRKECQKQHFKVWF